MFVRRVPGPVSMSIPAVRMLLSSSRLVVAAPRCVWVPARLLSLPPDPTSPCAGLTFPGRRPPFVATPGLLLPSTRFSPCSALLCLRPPSRPARPRGAPRAPPVPVLQGSRCIRSSSPRGGPATHLPLLSTAPSASVCLAMARPPPPSPPTSRTRAGASTRPPASTMPPLQPGLVRSTTRVSRCAGSRVDHCILPWQVPRPFSCFRGPT